MPKYDFSDFNEPAKYDFSDFESEPSGAVTALAKVANGASLGFVDEFAGGLEAVGQAAGVKGLGGQIPYIGFSSNGPTLDLETLRKAYTEGRDKERISQNEMSNAHPIIAGVSDLAGGLATLPVGGAATLAGRIGAASGMGAIAGLGSSDADLTQGEFSSAAADTAIGGALGGALQFGGEKILAPAFKKASNYISNSGPAKALGKTLASVAPENTERYLSRSGKVNEALDLEDVGQYFKDDALKQFQDHLGKLDSEAWKSLGTEPTLKKNDVLKIGESFVDKIIGGKNGTLTRFNGTGADADKIKAIYGQLDEISNAYGTSLSESDLKSIIQNLQKLGYSLEGSPRSSLQGQGLRELSGVYNEALKSMNANYAEKMIPVQEATSTMQSLNRQFINQQAPEQMDKFLRTAKKFNSLSDESEAVKSVRSLDKITGAGIEDMVKDRLTQESFYKSDTNGSRKTLAGALLGKAAEGAIGGAIGYGVSDGNGAGAATGALVGMSLDKYAGQVFKSILNGQMTAAAGVQKIAPQLGKFAQPLMNAAMRGNEAVAATHFLLQQSNPEYRKLIQGK